MNRGNIGKIYLCITALMLVSCMSTTSKTRIAAPLPPTSDLSGFSSYNNIQPASGHASPRDIQKTVKKKSCSFSSFQRKNTLGYEFDEASRISFSASPNIDVFNPSNFDMKVSAKFTYSFGGASNKRPCTYGSGYYGLVPYISNADISLNQLTDMDNIKSMINESRAR